MKLTRSKLRKIVKEALLKEVNQKDPEEATRAHKARAQALESVEDIRVNKLPQAKTEEERELHKNFRTWHFMWSKFYFYKKKYTFLIAFFYFLPILLRLLIRIVFHSIVNDKKNSQKYKARLSGLINSILGNKSSYRIS